MFCFKRFSFLCVLGCGLSSSMMGTQWLYQKNLSNLTESSNQYDQALTILNEYKDAWFDAWVVSGRLALNANKRLAAVLNNSNHTLEEEKEARNFYERATLANKEVLAKHLLIRQIIKNVNQPSNDVNNDRLNLSCCNLFENIVILGRNFFRPSVSHFISKETLDQINPNKIPALLRID